MDGPTSAEQSYLARPFVRGTRLILRFPRTFIAAALAFAPVATAYSTLRLGYRASRVDLVNPHSEYNRLWSRYAAEFGNLDDAVMVVEGKSRDEIISAIDDLAAELARADRLFRSVLHRVDLDKLRAKGLYYLPVEQLPRIDQQFSESRADPGRRLVPAEPGPDGPSACSTDSFGRAAAERRTGGRGRGRRASSMHSDQPGGDAQPRAVPLSVADAHRRTAVLAEFTKLYLISPDGRYGFITTQLQPAQDVFNPGGESAAALRRIVAETRSRHRDVKIGLTGLPIMEDDEMHASQSSMFWSSLISLIGVGLLFIAGFGGVRHALLANLILLVGMAWAFGYVTLAVGHLNILSVTFTVTMIGIGIDYGVYYVARYLQLRKETESCEAALLETSRAARPGHRDRRDHHAVAFFAAG